MLNGKTAIVTGGSRGIGRAIALRLSSLGADIAIIYAGNSEAAEKTAEECRRSGVRAIPYRCDISCGDEIWQRLKHCGVAYSAIIIYGDWATLGFLRNASAYGISVPEELSVISCCNTPLHLGNLCVTRLAARHSELGKAVGKLLMDTNGGVSNSLMVAPRLVEGNTLMQFRIKQEKQGGLI